MMFQGKTTNVHDQLKFTKLIDESSTNMSPAWKDNFVVSVYMICGLGLVTLWTARHKAVHNVTNPWIEKSYRQAADVHNGGRRNFHLGGCNPGV